MHSYAFYLIAGGGPGDGLQSNQTFDETQKTAIDFAIIHVCVFCVDMGLTELPTFVLLMWFWHLCLDFAIIHVCVLRKYGG